MYRIDYSNRFKKDLKRCHKRGLDMLLLYQAIDLLRRYGKLPKKYRPHILHGNRDGQWECHISPDWLLVWEQHDAELIMIMLTTGSHNDLF